MSTTITAHVCSDCLHLSSDMAWLGGNRYAALGWPRVPATEPEDGCFVCGNGGGQYVAVPAVVQDVPATLTAERYGTLRGEPDIIFQDNQVAYVAGVWANGTEYGIYAVLPADKVTIR